METPDRSKTDFREDIPLTSGLYLVPLPIGNLGDMSFRAVKTLKQADQIWAEDTRNLRKILSFFDISTDGRPLLACHEHNEIEMSKKLVETIQSGQSVAYVSDAGMPLISDPGFRLVQAAQASGQYYTALPGASSVTTALALSGLPTDRFIFLGFVPNKDAKRIAFFESQKDQIATIVAFESPKRIKKTLLAVQEALGGDTEIAIVREISKRFEEVIKGSVEAVILELEQRELKGEIVICMNVKVDNHKSDDFLVAALQDLVTDKKLSKKDAIKSVCEQWGEPRNRIYKLALDNIN